MAQIPPIDDSYIDDIIKASDVYNPALNKTQGVKLRELVKLLRDHLQQDIVNGQQITDDLGDLTVIVNNKQDILGYVPENVADKNEVNGYAGLDNSGKIPVALLPDYGSGDTFLKLAVNSAAYVYAFGTGVTAGYLLNQAFFESYYALFNNRLGLYGDNTDYAQNNGNSYDALKLAYLHMPQKQNRNVASIVEMGLNDFQPGADVNLTYLKIYGCLKSFLVNALFQDVKPGNSNFMVKTGTWSDFDTTARGGKAQYIGGSAIKAEAAGSTMAFGAPAEFVVIGTWANDGGISGTQAQTSGAFDVYVNDSLVASYDPYKRTNGFAIGQDNSITPEPVVITGCYGKTVKIVSRTDTPTIIEYIGWLAPANDVAPVFVSLVPRISDAAFTEAGTALTRAMLDHTDDVIKSLVKEFASWPVTVVDVNKYYSPNTQTFPDGRHPNKAGHVAIAKAYYEMIDPVRGWPVPHVSNPGSGQEQFVTVNDNGAHANYDGIDYAVSPGPLTGADFSSGTANVSGRVGQISRDNDFLYVCTGVSAWVRVALIQDKIDLFLPTIDDSGGAKTSDQLNTVYPGAAICQIARGILYNYQKVSSNVWEKTAKSIA